MKCWARARDRDKDRLRLGLGLGLQHCYWTGGGGGGVRILRDMPPQAQHLIVAIASVKPAVL